MSKLFGVILLTTKLEFTSRATFWHHQFIDVLTTGSLASNTGLTTGGTPRGLKPQPFYIFMYQEIYELMCHSVIVTVTVR